MPQTLDQKRAEFAWQCASDGVKKRKEKYVNMTKGASAFIMSNGLMQALAFYRSRSGSNKEEAELLLSNILSWIHEAKVFPVAPGNVQARNEFPETMGALFKASSIDYMRATQETLSMLRWLRQFADALQP